MTYRYISNFARTQGAKDKKERKKRGVGGYLASGAGVGLVGRLGGGYLSTQSRNQNKIASEASKRASASKEAYEDAYGRASKLGADLQKNVGTAGTDYVESTLKRANKLKDIASMEKSKYKTASKLTEDASKAAKSLGRYGKAAKIAGLVGAAGLAGVGGYNYGKNKQDERQSLGGQARYLKNKIKERLGR